MENEKEFIKGYNQGYILKKFDGPSFESLINGFRDNNDYTEGFSEGGKEAVKEIDLNKLNELNEIRSRNNDFERDR